MAESIDHDAARENLESAWDEVGSTSRPDAETARLIESVMSAKDITYKYILATAYVGKLTNQRIHARALQAGSSLRGAYDARSLCHKVVVPFEKSKGNLFGLSNEPFLNKPARHPEHNGDNPQLKNSTVAATLHKALDRVQSAKQADLFAGLVHILRLGLQNASAQKEVKATGLSNFKKVMNFLKIFLAETDGGARLVAVWGAFEKLLSEKGEVRVYSPNVSDTFAKTAGDVEVYYEGVLVSATECKQRPLTSDDVNHGIKKAMEKQVAEYCFVISAGIESGQDKAVRKAITSAREKLDAYVIDFGKVAPLLAGFLNPLRRGRFGSVCVEMLRKMRKFDSANIAADLWNKS